MYCGPAAGFGRLFIPSSLAFGQAREGSWKGWVDFGYVVANGLLFHATGAQFRFRGRMESIQTTEGVKRQLTRIGFNNIQVKHGRHFLVEAVE